MKRYIYLPPSPVPLQISITEDGAAANFTRSFAIKSGYYLCYSKVADSSVLLTMARKTLVFTLVPLAFYKWAECVSLSLRRS